MNTLHGTELWSGESVWVEISGSLSDRWNHPIRWLLRSSFYPGDAWEGGGDIGDASVKFMHHAKATTEHLYIQGNLFRKCLLKKHDPTGLLSIVVQGYTISDDWNFDRWKFQPVSIVPCFRNSDSLTVPWSNANMETMKLSVVFMFFFHWLGLTIWSLNGWTCRLFFVPINILCKFVQIVRGKQYMMSAFRLSLLHPAMTLMCVFLFALATWMYCNIAYLSLRTNFELQHIRQPQPAPWPSDLVCPEPSFSTVWLDTSL